MNIIAQYLRNAVYIWGKICEDGECHANKHIKNIVFKILQVNEI